MHAAAIAQQIRVRSGPVTGGMRNEPSTPITLVDAQREIYAPGDAASGYFRVEFGGVRIYRLLADGRRQICAFHFAGETFGFEGAGVHHFFAETLCATGIRHMAAGDDASGQALLLRMALAEMGRARQHLLVVGRPNALERLAAFLLDLSERQGAIGRMELQMSRQDIADYLGLTIETVSRSFSKLRDQAVLRLHGLRDLEICRPEVLEAMCE